MEGHDYEYLAAQYLRNHGYKFVEVTKASGDYGVDIIAHKGAHKYAVQCKYYSQPVGVKAVQEAVAGKAMYDCDKAMVITNSTYTKAAENLAAKNNVLLLSEIESAKGGSKIGNSITKILIFLSALFALSFLSFMFNGLKGQSVGHIISIVLTFAILIALTITLYFYTNKLLELKSLLFKFILGFCSFLFVLWEMAEFMSLPRLIQVSNYSELFKTLGISCSALCIVVIVLYLLNKPKKEKNESYSELASELNKFAENMEHISNVLAEVEDENKKMNLLLNEDGFTEINEREINASVKTESSSDYNNLQSVTKARKEYLFNLKQELCDFIKDRYGILQKDIYKYFPNTDIEDIRTAIYKLAAEEKIERKKVGNTYSLKYKF